MPDQYGEKPTKDLRYPNYSQNIEGDFKGAGENSMESSTADEKKTSYFAPPTRLDSEGFIGEASEMQKGNIKPRLPWPARDRYQRNSDRNDERPEPLREEPTRLFGSMARSNSSSKQSGSESAHQSQDRESTSAQPASDPVVGWLVILEGPGKGRSLEIGVGANSIGRDRSQKISINFGDVEIHREKHAFIVYEPRSRAFFLQGGDTRNLTYIEQKLVLTPVELKGGETILIGQTHLQFVPFCGPDFTWT